MKIRSEKQVLRHGFKQVLFSNYSTFKIGMGDFSENELKSLGAQIWEVPKQNWAFSGRRN